MQKINLNVGSKVFIKDQEYEIKKQIDLKTVLALNLSTNKLENISINHIKNEKESSELIINENIPEEHWSEAKNRLEIITPLLNKQTTKDEIEDIAIKNNLHLSTIYRWIAQYKENTLLSSLLPKHLSKGGKGIKTNKNHTIAYPIIEWADKDSFKIFQGRHRIRAIIDSGAETIQLAIKEKYLEIFKDFLEVEIVNKFIFRAT